MLQRLSRLALAASFATALTLGPAIASAQSPYTRLLYPNSCGVYFCATFETLSVFGAPHGGSGYAKVLSAHTTPAYDALGAAGYFWEAPYGAMLFRSCEILDDPDCSSDRETYGDYLSPYRLQDAETVFGGGGASVTIVFAMGRQVQFRAWNARFVTIAYETIPIAAGIITPEPATLALTAVGLLALLGMVWRRRARHAFAAAALAVALSPGAASAQSPYTRLFYPRTCGTYFCASFESFSSTDAPRVGYGYVRLLEGFTTPAFDALGASSYDWEAGYSAYYSMSCLVMVIGCSLHSEFFSGWLSRGNPHEGDTSYGENSYVTVIMSLHGGLRFVALGAQGQEIASERIVLAGPVITPEPSTLALTAGGLLALVGFARRRVG